MTIIVPDDFAASEAALTPDLLAGVVGGFEDGPVSLTLPKFSIESKVELADVLAAMRMPTALDENNADFSGITTAERLFISAVSPPGEHRRR